MIGLFSRLTWRRQRGASKLWKPVFVEHPIPAALAEGLQILVDSPQERKEIYHLDRFDAAKLGGRQRQTCVETAGTKSGNELVRRRRRGGKPDKLRLVFAGNRGCRNRPEWETERLDSNQPKRRRCPTNHQDVDRKTRSSATGGSRWRGAVPGSYLAEQSATVEIRENSSAQVPFQFSESLPVGTYHGRIEIEGQDGLAIDDQRFFTIRVSPAWKILVVRPEGVSPQNLLSYDRSNGSPGVGNFDLRLQQSFANETDGLPGA